MRLNPHYPARYLFTLGFACFTMERYEEVMAALKRALTRSPDHYGIHIVLAIIYIIVLTNLTHRLEQTEGK
jgi:tetratricopeptide (TPR) repeat protein